jgi:hypothetical protein
MGYTENESGFAPLVSSASPARDLDEEARLNGRHSRLFCISSANSSEKLTRKPLSLNPKRLMKDILAASDRVYGVL